MTGKLSTLKPLGFALLGLAVFAMVLCALVAEGATWVWREVRGRQPGAF
jgi:hypothetical protein